MMTDPRDHDGMICVIMMARRPPVAAVYCVQHRRKMLAKDDALRYLRAGIEDRYDAFAWEVEVEKRIAEIERGAW